MSKIFLGMLISFSFGVHAAELEIVSCNTDLGPIGERMTLRLLVDGMGRLIAKTGSLGNPTELSNDVKVDDIKSTDSNFSRALASVNSRRDTGIDPSVVAQVQHIFLSGNPDFHTDLFKLFDRDGKTLGWLGSTILLSGCY